MHSHSIAAALGMARNVDFSRVPPLAGRRRRLGVLLHRARATLAGAALHDHGTAGDVRGSRRITSPQPVSGNASARARSTCSGRNGRADHDAAFFSNILHDWDFATARACSPRHTPRCRWGGRIFIHEALLNDSGVGPPTTSTFSLLMLLGTQGRQFTYAELAKLPDRGRLRGGIGATPSYGYYRWSGAHGAERRERSSGEGLQEPGLRGDRLAASRLLTQVVAVRLQRPRPGSYPPGRAPGPRTAAGGDGVAVPGRRPRSGGKKLRSIQSALAQ